jgi:hypothetical protein
MFELSFENYGISIVCLCIYIYFRFFAPDKKKVEEIPVQKETKPKIIQKEEKPMLPIEELIKL